MAVTDNAPSTNVAVTLIRVDHFLMRFLNTYSSCRPFPTVRQSSIQRPARARSSLVREVERGIIIVQTVQRQRVIPTSRDGRHGQCSTHQRRCQPDLNSFTSSETSNTYSSCRPFPTVHHRCLRRPTPARSSLGREVERK